MVGLNDIPCVGTALNQISEATVEAAKRECSYLLCYKRNVTTLEDEFKEHGIQQEQMNNRIVRDRDDAKTIQKHVVIWQNEVNELNSQVEDFKKRYQDRPYWFKCFRSRSFPNLYSRFQLGREAVKKTETVTALTKRTKEYLAGEISNLPSFRYSPKSSMDYMDFKSRKNAYSKMLEALKNEDGPTVLGIYGMPGAGKTRMMEEASKQSMVEGIFDKVARADISQEVDVQKLQGQLARDINLHFPSEADEKVRAYLLEKRLRKGEKFLIILDDVWGKVPLNDIGIPFGDVNIKGCKILLTSRTQDACDNNKCKDVIKIGILEKDEAWELFKKNVDASTIDSLSDTNLAMEVCEQCGGLPLVIVSLGNALENKLEVLWKDALGQLKDSNLEDIDGKMYAGLKLSFTHLPKDAKSCLLLSSLFVEDAEIQFEELFKLVKGSGLLIKNYDTTEDARIRVESMVAKLISSSLLLRGRDDTVKLHDIVRDVARSIAAKEQEYAFLFCSSQWPDSDNFSGRKLIDLRFNSSLVDFPDDMVCPDLRILRLECGNSLQHPPDKFFTGFPNLRVLLLYNVSFSPQRSSIPYLENLRMLTISNCELSDLSFIVLLKKLEILILHVYVLPDKPLDLRGLKRLRMLYLEHCIGIAMLPQALSSLSSLEELHIPDGFRIRDEAAREFSPISPELSTLTRLTNLAVHLDDAMSCPDENICKNLLRFKISVGQAYGSGEHSSATRSLKFSYGNLEGRVKTLVERAEEVFLQKVTSLQNIFSNTDREAFVDLTRLIIEECHDEEHLARIPHRQLHQPMRSFSKLSVLEIRGSGFKYLFCASFARCLVQLQKLFIDDCKKMEEIVRNESHIEENIEFPNLTSMKLDSLPNLTSFYCNQRNGVPVQQSLFNEMVTFPALKKLEISGLDKVQSLFNGKVVFPALEKLKIRNLDNVREIWEKQCQREESVCPNLLRLSIRSCGSLRNVLAPSVARDLVHLEEMKIKSCETIKEIIGAVGDGKEINDNFVFPALKILQLRELPMLNSFRCYGSVESNIHQSQFIFCHKVVFPVLEVLVIEHLDINVPEIWEEQGHLEESFCQLKFLTVEGSHKLKNVIPYAMRQRLQNLEYLQVFYCDSLISETAEPLVLLPKLKSLFLLGLPKLMETGLNSSDIILYPNLKNLYILKCNNLRNVFLPSVAGHYLELLKDLKVASCEMMNEIIASVGKDGKEICINNNIEFPMLKTLELEKLPMMNSFWGHGIVEPNLDQQKSSQARKDLFPSLEEFWFRDLTINLKEVINLGDSTSQLRMLDVWSDNQSPQFIPPNWLLASRNLEHLSVGNCWFHEWDLFSLLGNSSWNNNPYGTISFRRLWTVEVDSCRLSTIFTCSVAKTLQQLRTLKVRSCGSMEEIVTDERRNDELVVAEDTCEEISFPLLSKVELEDLPNLKSFCSSANYSFKMPSLNEVSITRCPQMLSFTPRQISTPQVHVRIINQRPKGEEVYSENERVTDINSYLQQIMNTQEFVDEEEEVKPSREDKGKSIVIGIAKEGT